MTRKGREALRVSRAALSISARRAPAFARRAAENLVHLRGAQGRSNWRVHVGLAPELGATVTDEELTDAEWALGSLDSEPLPQSLALKLQHALRAVVARVIAAAV